jgi:LysR family transcriptional regulator, low CO2-responsive transcriptional regulator
MLNVSVRQIQIFVCAARHLSFARAAEELHLTPPAVSMQVRDLEETLSIPLFDRSGRKIALTTGGEYFLLHARRVLASLKDAEDIVARLRGVQAGRVAVGMVGTAKYFVPRLLAGFLREHPGVEVVLAESNKQGLVERLQRNEVDLAVMGTPPRELETRSEPFAAHPLGVVAAPDHPYASLPEVPPALLGRERFVVREPGSGTRSATDRYFQSQRIEPPIAMEMGSNETIKQAVMAGMGLAFLSLHTIAFEAAGGRIRVLEVPGLPLVRRWQLVHNRGKLLSPPTEALRYFILEQAETLLATLFPGLIVAKPA